AEVLEVDIVDDPEEGALGIALLIAGHAQCDGGIHDHAENTERKANDHGPKRALAVEALPEDAEEEDDENGRREVALHGLQVAIETMRALNHRDPGQRDHD